MTQTGGSLINQILSPAQVHTLKYSWLGPDDLIKIIGNNKSHTQIFSFLVHVKVMSYYTSKSGAAVA